MILVLSLLVKYLPLAPCTNTSSNLTPHLGAVPPAAQVRGHLTPGATPGLPEAGTNHSPSLALRHSLCHSGGTTAEPREQEQENGDAP